MFLWEKANQTRRAATLAASFTPEEFARLYLLREQYETSRDCGEFGLDERRLRFARWLVEQGRLNDGVEGA
ncbi:MAG TPA: hypothetical protein VF510_22750 [Ktedonobacterales bacterium]